MTVVCTRTIAAREREGGAEKGLLFEILDPRIEPWGHPAAVCTVFDGLLQSRSDIRGMDTMDAVANAIDFVDKRLTELLATYELFWLDGTAYTGKRV